ncbi:hypothetical protein ZWY2020_021090 [Hordeum vulgare]|nr:hypothetical protein ZWY2020_021090 [Hordeum vulgare]
MVHGSLGKLATRALSVAGKWQHQQLRRLNIHEYQIVVKAKSPWWIGNFQKWTEGYAHIVKAEEAEGLAAKMLNQVLVTKQTGPQGKVVGKVYLCEKMSLVNEMYFAITLDRKTAGPLIIACAEGGTSIEDLAEKFPDKIVKDAAKVVDGLAPKTADRQSSIEQIKKLYELLAISTDEIFVLPTLQVAAAKADLNYIGLDGEIGCMVNGAGLAMATMDIIVVEAFKILTSDDRVKAILVNILEESGMTLITAEDLDDAAEKAVKASSND